MHGSRGIRDDMYAGELRSGQTCMHACKATSNTMYTVAVTVIYLNLYKLTMLSTLHIIVLSICFKVPNPEHIVGAVVKCLRARDARGAFCFKVKLL